MCIADSVLENTHHVWAFAHLLPKRIVVALLDELALAGRPAEPTTLRARVVYTTAAFFVALHQVSLYS